MSDNNVMNEEAKKKFEENVVKNSNKQVLEARSTTLEAFIRKLSLKCADQSLVPIGKTSGYPILSTRKNKLCVTLIYYTLQMGRQNSRAIYPISHVVTAIWPTAHIIEYADLSYSNKIDFTQAIGLFPHQSISGISAKEYNEKKFELMGYYNEFIQGIINGNEFNSESRKKMGEILNLIMEPSLKLAYKHYGGSFFTYFCGSEWLENLNSKGTST